MSVAVRKARNVPRPRPWDTSSIRTSMRSLFAANGPANAPRVLRRGDRARRRGAEGGDRHPGDSARRRARQGGADRPVRRLALSRGRSIHPAEGRGSGRHQAAERLDRFADPPRRRPRKHVPAPRAGRRGAWRCWPPQRCGASGRGATGTCATRKRQWRPATGRASTASISNSTTFWSAPSAFPRDARDGRACPPGARPRAPPARHAAPPRADLAEHCAIVEACATRHPTRRERRWPFTSIRSMSELEAFAVARPEVFADREPASADPLQRLEDGEGQWIFFASAASFVEPLRLPVRCRGAVRHHLPGIARSAAARRERADRVVGDGRQPGGLFDRPVVSGGLDSRGARRQHRLCDRQDRRAPAAAALWVGGAAHARSACRNWKDCSAARARSSFSARASSCCSVSSTGWSPARWRCPGAALSRQTCSERGYGRPVLGPYYLGEAFDLHGILQKP